MAQSRKVSGTASTIPAGIGLGTALSIVITLLGAALTAYLVSAETIPESGIGFAALVILVLSAAAGALLAMNRIKRLRMQMCLLTGLCYYLSLLAMTALFFGGQYEGMGVTALAVLCGSGGIALLGAGAEKRGKVGRRKVAYR